MKTLPKKISREQEIIANKKVEKATRKIALVIAFSSVFIFFFKLLFF